MSSFTAYWSKDRVEAARRLAPAAFVFEFLFGGPHVSLPSLKRAGVKPGDWIYPITVAEGRLHVLGRMKVARLISEAEFKKEYRATGLGRFNLATTGSPDDSGPRAQLRFLAPTCVDDAAIGDEGTGLLFDLMLPDEALEMLRYRSQRGERGLKHVENGRLRSIASVQAVYRLAEGSARLMEEFVTERVAVLRGGAPTTGK